MPENIPWVQVIKFVVMISSPALLVILWAMLTETENDGR